MNTQQAEAVLEEIISEFGNLSYEHLAGMIGQKPHRRRVHDFNVVIEVVWDNKADGDVRVLGAIDDGSIRAFLPLSRDEIVCRYSRRNT